MECLVATRKMDYPKPDTESKAITVYDSLPVEEVMGIGGAFTEASAVNYAALDADGKAEFLKKYFVDAEYNFGRLHIGSCDFTPCEYSLADKEDLSDFSIEQDKKYIIPMVKDALKATNGNLKLFASPWSPPAFMKDNGTRFGGGKLLDQFKSTYAEYFVKYLTAYKAEGIDVFAVTVQNEPHAKMTWESCNYTAEEEAEFAVKYLRPALDKAGLGDVKIILWDHNRERLYERTRDSLAYPGADKAVWGIGFHWYTGHHFDQINLVKAEFPQIKLIETELCHGDHRDKNDEQRALHYAMEYIECIRRGTVAICDWNLMLDTKEGGPFHNRNTGGCYAALYYDNDSGKIKEDAIFAPIAAISKALDEGDKILTTTSYDLDLHPLAVQKKNGQVVVILLNKAEEERTVRIRLNGDMCEFIAPAKSLTVNTLEK